MYVRYGPFQEHHPNPILYTHHMGLTQVLPQLWSDYAGCVCVGGGGGMRACVGAYVRACVCGCSLGVCGV